MRKFWLLAFILLGCTATHKLVKTVTPVEDPKNLSELREEQRAFIAHEFFLRARAQELEGNDAVALSYFQIAYEYDTKSRDLCFLLTDKLKAAGKMDSALVTGMRCLDLAGEPNSHEYQMVAEILLRKNEIKKALVYYQKALALDDQDKDLLYTLATLYESLKDISKQVSSMEKLLPLVDFPVRLVDKQAMGYRSLGKIDSVASLYRKAWDATSTAYFGEKLAAFYEEEELYTSVLDVLRKLIQQNPENLPYQMQMARAFILGGQTDSALAAYEVLNKKNPEEREIMTPYATLLFEKKKYEEAKKLFQKLSKLMPDNPNYHFYLGSIAMEQKERSEAEANLKKAIDLDDKIPDFWVRLGSFYLEQGQGAKAEELLEKMGDAKNWYASYVQGIVYNQVAKNREADLKKLDTIKNGANLEPTKRLEETRRFREKGIEHLTQALKIDTTNHRVLFELGVELEQLDKRTESISIMKRLIKLDSTDATALNFLGYMLVEENTELELAGKLIDKALQVEPKNGAFLDSKGWMYFQKKDFANAKKYLELAMELIPKDATILEHYALILENLGMGAAATEEWRLILTLDPNHELARKKLN